MFLKSPKHYLFLKNNLEVDFTIMSLCKYGVLSASTFALCSAYYANLDKKNKTFFVAPKYWENHRSKKY